MTINQFPKAVIQSRWEHSSKKRELHHLPPEELKQKHQELTVKAPPPVSALFLNTEVALKGRMVTENTGSI